MGWIIALATLCSLAILPIGVCAIYNEDGPIVSLLIGIVRVKIFPKHKCEKNKKTSKKEKPETKKAGVKSKEEKKRGGSVKDFLPLLNTVLDFLGAFRRKVRVKRLEMKLVMAGDDPCDLAVNYGKAWAALSNLMPLFERAFVIRKRDLEVECDFTADQTRISARLDVTITVGRLLTIAIYYGIKILYQLIIMSKTKKAVQNNEQESS